MTELMRTLYEYVCKKEIQKYLDAKEYDEVQRAVEKQKEKFLDRSVNRSVSLNDLLGEVDLGHTLELEAMFEAAVALCAKLNHLTQGLAG